MNPLITLAALTGPRDSSPATVPIRPMEARDLPELTRVYPHAYAEGSAHLHGGSTGWIADTLDGVRGLPLAEPSLVTTTLDGHLKAANITTDTTMRYGESTVAFIAELFTDAAHRRQGLVEELLHRCIHAPHSAGTTTVACSIDTSNSTAMPSISPETFRRLTDGRDGHGD